MKKIVKKAACAVLSLAVAALGCLSSSAALTAFADEISTNGTPAAAGAVRGDVNIDGVVDTLDALLALRISLGFERPSATQLISADMNADGVIDSTDALSILKLAISVGEFTVMPTAERSYILETPVQGIDVSFWQGEIDFAAVKAAGCDFVMIRAGGGTDDPAENHEGVDPRRQGVDSCFERNYAQAKAAGLKVGVYWYSWATNEHEALREAQSCIRALGGRHLDYPVVFDIENEYQMERGRGFVSSLTRTFCGAIKLSGYCPAIYTSASFAYDFLEDDVLESYDLWVAQWSASVTYPLNYTMWQYGIEPIDGIQGGVDHDLCYFDYPAYIRASRAR